MKRSSFTRQSANAVARGELPPAPIPFPTALPPNTTPRYLVPAGVPCAISRVSPLEWSEYRTVRPTPFDRFERYELTESGNFYEFRHAGYLMLVHRRHVVHRDDSY